MNIESDRKLPAPHPDYPPTLGAHPLGDGRWQFRVWAPKTQRIELRVIGRNERLLPMTSIGRGYYDLTVDDLNVGDQYFYRIDGERDRPDPASRFQPDGVHQASALVDPQFPWEDDNWRGLPLVQTIAYELHVGTMTEEGTFDAAIEQLESLVELGVTAIEIMPVAQFPGNRNWGYDGVHPFAVQNSYGGPAGLQRLVNACHRRGLAVVLDVVYNHLGPEGNYLDEFGDYFTDRYRTPWGKAINFDGTDSDEVRRFFIENALHWIHDFHIDGLRLDAVHAIYDFSAKPFLQELAEAVRIEGQRLGRQVFTIAESDLNDSRLIRPVASGGLGVDAQWADDLHHAIHHSLTGESDGYYADYRGWHDVADAYRQGFVINGRYSVFRRRRHGNSACDISPDRFFVCAQNHDQVGNRMLGERLGELVSFEQLKLAAGIVLMSPYQPLLFMGEEYGEASRFQYFVSHGDPELVEAVRKGRREEFSHFGWQGEVPDPQDPTTFQRSKLDPSLRHIGHHRVLRSYYRTLITLRKSNAALAMPARDRMQTVGLSTGKAFAHRRWAFDNEIVSVFCFGESATTLDVPLGTGSWTTLLDSADRQWNGPGSQLLPNVRSAGKATLTFAANSVAVLKRALLPEDNES